MCSRYSGRVWQASLVAVVSACAPPAEELEPLPIDVCGQDAPKQILALGDDELVDEYAGAARFGDRWLFGVRRFAIPLTSIQSAFYPPEARNYAQLDARVESVGACGEDRRVVADGVDLVFPPRADDGPWLGCRRDTYSLHWFDPAGRWAAQPVGDGGGCGPTVVRGHDVFFFADGGDFVHARLRDEGVSTEVLVTDVTQSTLELGFPNAEIREIDDVYLLRGEDRVLVSVDLATREVEEVLENIDEFSISDDRRWILWIHALPDDPNDIVPEARLVDRTTGDYRILGRPEWPEVSARLDGGFAMVHGFDGPGTSLGTELISLSTQRSEFYEDDIYVAGSDREDRVVVSVSGRGVEVVDLGTGERWIVLEDNRQFFFAEGAIWYDDPTAYQYEQAPSGYGPVDVIRIPLATLKPEIVYRRVFSSVQLSGDRWSLVENIDDNGLADLILLDGEHLVERRIDDGVVPLLMSYELDGPMFKQPWRTDDFVYQVHERASDRGGMWRVRFTE